MSSESVDPAVEAKLAKFREETPQPTTAVNRRPGLVRTRLPMRPFFAIKVIVPNGVSADDANRLYGEQYGTDWEYEAKTA